MALPRGAATQACPWLLWALLTNSHVQRLKSGMFLPKWLHVWVVNSVCTMWWSMSQLRVTSGLNYGRGDRSTFKQPPAACTFHHSRVHLCFPQSSFFASSVLRQWVLTACLGESSPSFLKPSLSRPPIYCSPFSSPSYCICSQHYTVRMAGGSGVGSLILLLSLNY